MIRMWLRGVTVMNNGGRMNQLLEDLRLTPKYNAMKLYNYKTENFHESLKSCRDKFIVIDNGDLLLDQEDRRFINFECSNQYMLF